MTEITGGELFARALAAEGALRRCRENAGPSLYACADHDANLAIPAEMAARFFEVYSGPAKPETI
jgi:acetolactate synthase-1/2/3 large subunit